MLGVRMHGFSCISLVSAALRVRARHVRWSSALTSEIYSVERLPFAKVENSDLEAFTKILGGKGVDLDPSDLSGANQDWMKKYVGQSRVILKPTNAEDLSKVMKHCYDRNLAVVPQGGNTGLVGGSVPVFDEIIISLGKMNKIRKFDDLSGILTTDAGVVLQTLDDWLRTKGYIFPLDLGAKGTCQVGGNVATNAGGLRLLRYGSLHGSILGIEAVLPDGQIFDGLSTLRKDNTGYDLKQLFIGSEGTLGVITGISILCPPKPKVVNVAFLGLRSFDDVQKTFKRARADLSEILSSFECMDAASLQTVAKHYPEMQPPFEETYPYSVLIETSGSVEEHDQEKLSRFLEDVMEHEIVVDGVLATDDTQAANLWKWREGISETSQMDGGVYKYDVSLPLSAMWDLVSEAKVRLCELDLLSETDTKKPVVNVIGYGHIGDGNLHLNIPVRQYDKRVENALEPWVFKFVADHKGSISAEHGLGFQKAHALHYSKSPELIKIMHLIKKQFDPKGILNPYKYLE